MWGLTERNSGIVYALVTACGLGAITTQAKIFYADGGNALTLMLVRFAASTFVFGILLLLKRQSLRVEPGRRWPLAVLGFVWSGAMICYLLAVESMAVSLAVLILYFYPLLVLAYSVVTRQLSASPGLIGLFLGAFGGLYLALSGGPIEISPVGIMFATMASCGAAFTFISGARVAPTMSPLLMTFWINATGLLMILPMMLDSLYLTSNLQALSALAAATVFYLVAILSQFQALARLNAARAAFLLNLEPIVSILLAYLILSESLNLLQLSGVILVLSAVIVSLRFRTGKP